MESFKNTLKIDQKGICFIQRQEGCELKPYKCSAGAWTIGVGHKILKGEKFTTITAQEAYALLQKDLLQFEKCINTTVQIPLNQHQFNALVSFVFNIGGAVFKASTFLKKLNTNDIKGAADQFLQWKYVTNPTTDEKEVSDGLLARRKRERTYFLTGEMDD